MYAMSLYGVPLPAPFPGTKEPKHAFSYVFLAKHIRTILTAEFQALVENLPRKVEFIIKVKWS